MARKIENWRRRKEKNPKAGLSKGEVQRLVERSIQQIPSSLPKSLTIKQLRVEDELSMGTFDDLEPDQVWVISPSEPEDGQVLVWTDDVDGPDPDGATFPGNWQAADAVLPDGTLPGAVTNLVVTGGPRWLAINWDGIENHNFVTYNVHVSESASFTADETNKVGSTSATLFYAYALQDGTLLEYWEDSPTNTDPKEYYVQVIPQDADGASTDTPLEVTEALDPNGPDDIAAGAITAAKLEAIMVLATQLIAGSESAARVEVGVDPDDGFLGIRAYSFDGNLTFSLDGSDGSVFVNGPVQFGDSFLRTTQHGHIELAERASTGYQTPSVVQSQAGFKLPGTTVTATFSTPSAAGNQCIASVDIYDSDGTLNAPSTPSGWTLIGSDNKDIGSEVVATYLYYKNTTTSLSALTVTLNDTVTAALKIVELSGVVAGAPEDSGFDADNIGELTIADIGNTSQTDMLILGGVMNTWYLPGPTEADDWDYDSFVIDGDPVSFNHGYQISSGITPQVRQQSFYKQITAIENPDFYGAGSLATNNPAVAWIITYKAAVIAATASDADTLQVYAKEYISDPGTSSLTGQARLVVINETGAEIPFLRNSGDLFATMKDASSSWDGMKAMSFDPHVFNPAAITMSSQRLAGIAFMVDREMTVSNMSTVCTTTGTSFNNYSGGALYWMASDGDWQFIQSTGANNGTLFTGATALRTKALAGSVSLVPGLVYVAAVIASWTGTAPAITQTSNVSLYSEYHSTTMFPRAARLGVTSQGTVEGEQTVANLTAVGNGPWIGLS